MDPKLVEIQKLLDAADGNLSSARTMIRELTGGDAVPLDIDKKLEGLATTDEGKVIEGVFDGEAMVASDGQTYPVPPNYASKSKLVEGDTLKLTIADDGSFVFKQIAPVDRRNAVGTLALEDGNYTISAEGKKYKVLTASVTFYKANPGDQITIVLPKEHDAVWAVMENVIKKPEATSDSPTAPTMEPTPEEIIEEEKNTVVTPVNEAETVIPVPAEPKAEIPVFEPTKESTAATDNTPEIEFPAGAPAVSDEQLLQNLKNNLQKIDQPAFTPPESTTPKPVDNIVANDLAQMNQATEAPVTPPASNDKPIAELDI